MRSASASSTFDGEPDRPAPVGVAAEQAAARLTRLVVDRQRLRRRRSSAYGVAVGRRQRPDAVRGQELRLVEHPRAAPGRSRSGSSSASSCVSRRRRPARAPADQQAVQQVGPAPLQPAQPGGEVGQRVGRPGRRVSHRRAPAAARPSSAPAAAGTLPSGLHQHVVEEAVRRRPTATRRCEPNERMRVRDGQEVLQELGGDVVPGRVRHGPARRRSAACSGRRTPSSWWRRTARAGSPAGSGADRSNRPMLSMPRKPPSNRFEPSASLRLTHQREVQQQLGEDPDQEVGVAAGRRSGTPARPPRRAPAG